MQSRIQNDDPSQVSHESNSSISIIAQPKNFQERIFKAVGPLISRWKSRQDHILALNYGTAFAVNRRILITCTHNIYSEVRGQFCTEALFYPNAQNKPLLEVKCYNTASGRFYECLQPKDTFRSKPKKGELCLLVLQTQLPNSSFIPIGSIPDKNHEKLTIIGYPSEKYCKEKDVDRVKFNRNQLTGSIISIEQQIIHHNLKTSIGNSGSPILYQFETNGSIKAVGIHTHKGLRFGHNLGLYFNQDVLGLVQRYEASLKVRYKFQEGITHFDCEKETKKQVQSKSPSKSQSGELVAKLNKSSASYMQCSSQSSLQFFEENRSIYIGSIHICSEKARSLKIDRQCDSSVGSFLDEQAPEEDIEYDQTYQIVKANMQAQLCDLQLRGKCPLLTHGISFRKQKSRSRSLY